jgi:hypothetical protein
MAQIIQTSKNYDIKNVTDKIDASFSLLKEERITLLKEATGITEKKIRTLELELDRLIKKYDDSDNRVKRLQKRLSVSRRYLICIMEELKKHDLKSR